MKYRIKEDIFDTGEKLYSIQYKRFGLLWTQYTEDQTMGVVVHKYSNLEQALKFFDKLRNFKTPKITNTNFIYNKEDL